MKQTQQVENHRTHPAWLISISLSIPMFMASLDNLVVTNALPVIRTNLGATLEELTWTVNAYTLTFASCILMSSALADRFGRRRVFLLGIFVFTASSAWCGISDNIGTLITARTLQGIGGSAVMPLSLALLSTSVPERMRATAIGIWGGVAGLGVALGPLIGGAVVEGMTWHAIFWINVPFGLLCIPLVWITIPESRGRPEPLDFPGLALVGIGLFGITYGIVRGNDAGWTSLEVLTALIGGVFVLVSFIWWESRAATPLLPLRLFSNRSFSMANIVGFLFFFGTFGVTFILLQFLQVVQGASPLEAGLMTMPWTLAPLIVSPLAGLLTSRVGTRPVIVAGMALMSIGLLWIGAILDPGVEYIYSAPLYMAAGVGMGMVFAPIATATLQGMAPEDRATASGTNMTIRQVGIALGVATLTAIFTALDGTLTPTGFTDAASPAILTGAAALVLGTFAAFFFPKHEHAREKTQS